MAVSSPTAIADELDELEAAAVGGTAAAAAAGGGDVATPFLDIDLERYWLILLCLLKPSLFTTSAFLSHHTLVSRFYLIITPTFDRTFVLFAYSSYRIGDRIWW
jgi:hypothetical protein